jgi:PAS domain S-box-containing protein
MRESNPETVGSPLKSKRPDTDALIVIAMWLIAAATLLLSALPQASPRLIAQVNTWVPTLLQGMSVCLLWRFLAQLAQGPRRSAWRIVLAGVCFDLVAAIAWNLAGSMPLLMDENLAYGLSIGYYPIAIAAGVMFYRDLGGSFRRWTTWLDFGTLLLGIGATLWLFFLRPHLAEVESEGVIICVLFGYAAGNAMVMVMVALIAMQIADWRSERALALLMSAVTITFLGLLGWVGSPHRDEYVVGPWFNIVGIAIPYCLLGVAITWERRRPRAQPVARAAGGRLSFLPVLSVLIAIALLFGEKADLHGLRNAAMLAFVLAVALLIALRQQGVRYEIGGLQRALAIQEAEARLSELVRRSSDLIALVLPGMRLSYVSPAALDVLGTDPETLKAQPASRLLGPHNEQRMAQFLREVGGPRQADAAMEVSFQDPGGRQRVVRVNGRRQESEPAVGAISLTVQDVTEELRLEREVLDTAERERARLSSDIHDGLGQELTGIALLLKSLDVQARGGHEGLLDSLQQIEDHVDDALRLTQDLASGLSPAPAGAGSLVPMLEALALRARERFGFPVECRLQPPSSMLAAAATEHLYRIAQESLNNAARHSGCRRASLELRQEAGHLHLRIADDGCGIDSAHGGEGLGLRMMAHRARALGGALALHPSPGGGTHVHVVVPEAGVADGAGGGRC